MRLTRIVGLARGIWQYICGARLKRRNRNIRTTLLFSLFASNAHITTLNATLGEFTHRQQHRCKQDFRIMLHAVVHNTKNSLSVAGNVPKNHEKCVCNICHSLQLWIRSLFLTSTNVASAAIAAIAVNAPETRMPQLTSEKPPTTGQPAAN